MYLECLYMHRTEHVLVGPKAQLPILVSAKAVNLSRGGKGKRVRVSARQSGDANARQPCYGLG